MTGADMSFAPSGDVAVRVQSANVVTSNMEANAASIELQEIGTGDLVEQVFVYDAKSLTLYESNKQVYAQVAAPGTQVHTGQPDLFESRLREAAHLVEDERERQTATSASGARDDAVGALLVASGLHPQGIGGAAAVAGA